MISFKKKFYLVFCLFLFSCSSDSPPSVYFVDLKDGDSVTNPISLEFGVNGMKVEPAGRITSGYGHHHLLINQESVIEGAVVPSDKNHIHFGLGQKKATIELEQGEHILTLQFADGLHQSYGERMSKTINILVE